MVGPQHNVLLLQGPVGPFFSRLQDALSENGIETWRVVFNAGDRVFSATSPYLINFSGNLDDWNAWLLSFSQRKEITQIILFGSRRILHQAAISFAKKHNIMVLSLEEGYLRPGFITAEYFGNNGDSPCQAKLPDSLISNELYTVKDYRNNMMLYRYSAVYYVMRTLFSKPAQRQFFHKKISPVTEVFYWARNYLRYLYYRKTNQKIVDQLIEQHKKNYFMVALQVNNDCQLEHFSNGWSTSQLIISAIKSFSSNAPKQSYLVFKIHPLERGHTNQRELIYQIAKQYSVVDRVKVIDTGVIAPLLRETAGVLTINSTVGFSAIHAGVPLLLFGKAVYGHHKLAVIGKSEQDIDAFWYSQHVAEEHQRKQYLQWIKQQSLKPGDFYVRAGINEAIHNIKQMILTGS